MTGISKWQKKFILILIVIIMVIGVGASPIWLQRTGDALKIF